MDENTALPLTYCTIVKKPFTGGFSDPAHKKIHSWNRSESLRDREWCNRTIALSDSKRDRALHPAPSGQHQIERSKKI
ncbi:hypothetical protein QUA81_18645 [Microcoleus sp. F6_B4]